MMEEETFLHVSAAAHQMFLDGLQKHRLPQPILDTLHHSTNNWVVSTDPSEVRAQIVGSLHVADT